MGRIDEALRRADLEVSHGTGARAPAPIPSPWRFEEHEGAKQEPRSLPSDGSGGGESQLETTEHQLLDQSGRSSYFDGFDGHAAAERLVVSKDALPLQVEQFRGLAATLLSAQREQPLRSVIVTSACPGDGKSHVAVNLALTLSESYHLRVLLIDADLRRPTLHRLFGIRNSHGLSDALAARSDGKLATVDLSPLMTLLPAGRANSNPLGGLASERMKRLVATAVSRFDWVVVDTPPVGILADARLVSETVDGAILVVRAGTTRFPDLAAAADAMGHERILGIVLNAVDPIEIRGEGYYRHYYYGHDGDKR